MSTPNTDLPRFWTGDLSVGDAKADGADAGQFRITYVHYCERNAKPRPAPPSNPYTGRAGDAWLAAYREYAGEWAD